MTRIGIGLVALVLAGCASMSAVPLSGMVPASGPIASDLHGAAWNLDQAVAIGALDANDPAPRCLHGVLADLGLEPAGATPPAAFTPKRAGLVSEGAVLYIRARHAERLSRQGLTVPADCKALIGQFVMDAARLGKGGFPGGSLLPSLR